MFPSKLTPNFDTTENQVLEQKGNIVTISGGGKTRMREVSQLKKIPASDSPAPATG